MSILKDYYKIIETPPTSGVLLITPVTKFFSFDFNNISHTDNQNTNVFWNFGDPYNTDNEKVISTSSNSMVRHTYTYSGTYSITCIANVNDVPFHIDQLCTIN